MPDADQIATTAEPAEVKQAYRQPWLHDLVCALRSPTQAWSATSGQITGDGITGYIHADIRVLRTAIVDVAGMTPVPVGHRVDAADEVVFTGLLSGLGDGGIDPTVRVVRRRRVSADGVHETVAVHSWAAREVVTTIGVECAADLAPLDVLKMGHAVPDATPRLVGEDSVEWSDAVVVSRLRAPGADVGIDGPVARLTWQVTVPPAGDAEVSWLVSASRRTPRQAGATDREPLPVLSVTGEDRRWGPVLRRAVADVDALRMSLAGVGGSDPADADGSASGGADFAGAGAPWFLTLFGRDSLWAARMMLPLSTRLAGSTLRVLASVQGRRHDEATGEAPGKILHEVRADGFDLGELVGDTSRRALPPVYYGAIDATALWVLTMHDAWRWGLPDAEVTALLPALEAALGWLVDSGDVDGDGFLEYIDTSGTGLANQGWKDSGDSIRRGDGSLAGPPIALCEVQAYAYAAARAGADLLDAFGRPGAAAYRDWAAGLREAFRGAFWVRDEVGPFPAIALDGDKRPVASLTSNIGHLLGTGILDESESATVAGRLAAPDMFSGYGIRTLSALAPGYSPTGYHVGSVWPHDTAIAVAGLSAAGLPQTAAVADGLLAAIDAFGGRVPELFAGDDRDPLGEPTPYPASCRPQAWAAAAAVSLLTSILGLRPEGGTLTARPVQPWLFGAMAVRGLRVGDSGYDVDVDASGQARVTVVED